ncbi:MAG TPA: YHS domain-containing (seleno)protein [Roseimicrobium sp.]|nr:YHS domain-containing (seleno)protein [Roseimicrobium sp.]
MFSRSSILPICFCAVLLLPLITGLRAAESPAKSVRIEQYNLPASKVALGGHDPVGYFTKAQPIKGRAEFAAVHQGVTYHFASTESRTMFLSAPDKYVPTYGGWCATAMAKGEKVEIDPANFKISNGRLFLFYKGLWGNARKDWDKDESAMTQRADASWKRIAGE